MRYGSARELFEAAREAMADTVKATNELEALEESQNKLPSGLSVGTVGGHLQGDKIGRIVARTAERKERLERRIEANEELIDLACEILYGGDQISDGLASLAPEWWSDAIYHHYLNLMSWPEVAELMGYHSRWIQSRVAAAFDLADGYGMVNMLAGRGIAEE